MLLHPPSIVSKILTVLIILSIAISSVSLAVSAGPVGGSGSSGSSNKGDKVVLAPVIVVAGAGPASLFFVHRLLQLNSNVKIVIYERRSRPLRYSETQDDDVCIAGDNAFGFGLSQKTQNIISPILNGQLLTAIQQISLPILGGTMQMINRRELCAEMIYSLQQEYGINGQNRLEICFNSQVTNIHLRQEDEEDEEEKKEDNTNSVIVRCRRQSTTTTTTTTKEGQDEDDSIIQKVVPYSLLIAADGLNSNIRNDLIERNILTGHRYGSKITWKALQLPPQPQLNMHDPKIQSLLGYSTRKDRGRLVPRYKDRFVLLNFRKVRYANNPPLDATTPQELKDSIRQLLVNVTEFPPDHVLQTFLDEPPGGSDYLCLNKHCAEEYHIALIGDASVGMYNLLGQGCNSAFQQANLLAESVANVYNNHYYKVDVDDEISFDTNLSNALLETSNITVKETKAIQDLNLVAHILRKPILNLILMKGYRKATQCLMMKPEMSYSEISKDRRLLIWVSKFFWRLERSTKSMLSRTESSSTK